MERRFAEQFFPKNLAKTERRRSETLQRRLNSDQIASLLSMRYNREPRYGSIKDFYTEEYAQALEAGAAPAELANIPRYRNPTAEEVNLLFCDIHAKEKMYEAAGGQPAE
jgi:hypothetical protein